MNVPKVISGVIPPGQEKGEVRFKTQAIDTSLVPLAPVNSIAPIQSIAPLEWDPVTNTVNDISYDLNAAPPLTVLINDPFAYCSYPQWCYP